MASELLLVAICQTAQGVVSAQTVLGVLVLYCTFYYFFVQIGGSGVTA